MILAAWGFWALIATLPDLQRLPSALVFFAPYQTQDLCEAVRDGVSRSGAYARVDPCELW